MSPVNPHLSSVTTAEYTTRVSTAAGAPRGGRSGFTGIGGSAATALSRIRCRPPVIFWAKASAGSLTVGAQQTRAPYRSWASSSRCSTLK